MNLRDCIALISLFFKGKSGLINRSFIQIKQENYNANQVKPYCDFPCRNKSQQQGLYS